MPAERLRERLAARVLAGAVIACSFGFAGAVDAAGGGAPAAPGFRGPYLPAADSDVLQQVPPASTPKLRDIAALKIAYRADPSDSRRAVALARAYIDFGRHQGDAQYAGYAEAIIAPWVTGADPPATALIEQATILQYRHRFDDARSMLGRALQREPRNAQGWLTLATLDMVQGRYANAGDACKQVGVHGGFVLGVACTANLQMYLGDARKATALLEAIRASGGKSASFNAWIEGLLAESAERVGDWTSAEAHYRKALAHAPGDNFLLVAYADLLLDRNRPKEVLALLADHTSSDTTYLRIALAHGALRSGEAGRHTWVMAARFEALAQRGDDYYGREQVRFALDLQRDPRSALALAQQNWVQQKAPWDARVLLEAALAAKQPQAAAEVLAFVAATRLEDPAIEALARQLQVPSAKLAVRR